jgi:hypothetical protein
MTNRKGKEKKKSYCEFLNFFFFFQYWGASHMLHKHSHTWAIPLSSFVCVCVFEIVSCWLYVGRPKTSAPPAPASPVARLISMHHHTCPQIYFLSSFVGLEINGSMRIFVADLMTRSLSSSYTINSSCTLTLITCIIILLYKIILSNSFLTNYMS